MVCFAVNVKTSACVKKLKHNLILTSSGLLSNACYISTIGTFRTDRKIKIDIILKTHKTRTSDIFKVCSFTATRYIHHVSLATLSLV
jgi:hypothetical protein